MKSEKLSFRNSDDFELSAKLDLPENEPLAFALFAHCFTCSKDLSAARNISRALTAYDIAVMSFDFTGIGSSEGAFEETNFSSNISDLIDASDFLAENYQAPKIIIGHSLGGAAALFAGARMENIEAVVTIGAPFDPYHVTHLLGNDIDKIKEEGKAEVNIGGRPFTISKTFVDDLNQHHPEQVAKSLRKPLLIMHSPQDTIVGIENAAKIYTAAHHPKSYISLDGADHLLSDKKDSQYVGKMIASWVEKYLGLEHSNTTDPIYKSKSIVAVETGNEGFFTKIKAGDHAIVADEPTSVGGTNKGPSPYELLASALGACTTMTLQMYARHKKWDLKSVVVHVDHDKNYAEDCENCENSNAKIDHFDRKIELIGDLDETQKKRLLEIADKCPVHKTLHSEVVVNSSLIDN